MSRYLFIIVILFSKNTFAQFEWVVIERGSYQGSGFARDRWTAIDRCAKDVDKKFIALAQRCCETSKNDTSAGYENRCAGGYNGSKNSRSFDGGLAAYFCWPTNTAQEMASGYWYVQSPVRPYKCEELIDVSYSLPKPAIKNYIHSMPKVPTVTPPKFNGTSIR